jgi:hypothetical protein
MQLEKVAEHAFSARFLAESNIAGRLRVGNLQRAAQGPDTQARARTSAGPRKKDGDYTCRRDWTTRKRLAT